jgi:predicted type IV restriction endonuclease
VKDTNNGAKTQLSKLIAAAERVEEVIIVRSDKPWRYQPAPSGSADSKGASSR